jgi:hypothetical protein
VGYRQMDSDVASMIGQHAIATKCIQDSLDAGEVQVELGGRLCCRLPSSIW